MPKKAAPRSPRKKLAAQPEVAWAYVGRPDWSRPDALENVHLYPALWVGSELAPDLIRGWEVLPEWFVEHKFLPDQLVQLRVIARSYLCRRKAYLSGSTFADLIAKIEEMERASDTILRILNKHDPEIIRRLENAKPGFDGAFTSFQIEQFRSHISQFRARSKLALKRAQEDHDSTLQPNGRENWEIFIHEMLSWCADNGLSTAVSKAKGGETASTYHPSKFVRLVWALLQAMPADLREHDSSIWGLADDLHEVRSKLKIAQ